MPISISGSGTITGISAGGLPDGCITTPELADGAVISTKSNGVIYSGTVQASTSGTSIDFTSIPSWVKRITVMFNGVSTNGTSDIIIQIGPSAGVETTGYLGAGQTNGAGFSSNATNGGFDVYAPGTAADAPSGQCILSLLDATNNIWAASSIMTIATRGVYQSGAKTISGGVLSRVRVTTAGGVNTFDAGSINILYE